MSERPIHRARSLGYVFLVLLAFGCFLKPLSSQAIEPQNAIAKQDAVNVRGQASIEGEVIAKLRKGESVRLLEEITLKNPKAGEPTKWYRIRMPTTTPAWVHAEFIDASNKTVIPKKINVRAGAGENFSVVSQLKKGDVVKEIRRVNDWIEIEMPSGASAFVAADFLEKQSLVRSPVSVVKTTPLPPPVAKTQKPPARSEPIKPVKAPIIAAPEPAPPFFELLPPVVPLDPIVKSSPIPLVAVVPKPLAPVEPVKPKKAPVVAVAKPAPPLLTKQPPVTDLLATPSCEISVPLIIDNKEHGEIKILTAGKDELKLEAESFLKEINGLITEGMFRRLKSLTDKNGRLNLSTIKGVGLNAFFDESKLEFRVDVPPEIRAPLNIDVYSRRPPADRRDLVTTSSLSGFFNLRSGLEYIEQSPTGADESFRGPLFDMSGAINYNNWVVEGQGFYNANVEPYWQRGDLRLLRDDPERMLRYTVGDLSYPVTSFQTFRPMAGFTVAKNFSLQPYRVTEPLGSTSFFLKSPSKVEVLVNGQLVQTLQLPAGPQNLSSFSFASGANDVVLRITDQVGRMETIQLSFFFDSKLLQKGEHEFAYSVGLPSRTEKGNYRYTEELPTFSAFHRRGWSDNFTAGLNVQADPNVQLGGAEGILATPIGTFQTDAALSYNENGGFGHADRLQYHYYNAGPENIYGSSWTMGVQYKSPRFSNLGSDFPDNTTAFDISARYSQRLGWNLNASIGGSYQIRRAVPNTKGVTFVLSKRWGNIITDLTLARYTRADREIDYRAFLSLIWQFPSQRQTVSANYDTLTSVGRTDWQYHPRYEVGGINANAGVQHSPDSENFVGGLRYAGYRSEVSLNQDVTTPQPGRGIDSRTSLRLGTALVYADGEFALSRPVRDSFAIVIPEKSLAGQTVGVDPVGANFRARADSFGPAVIPDLQSYTYRKISVDPDLIPTGFDPGQDTFTVFPTYKSGTVIRIGAEGTTTLSGTLQTAKGKVIVLQGGEITNPKAPTANPVTFFTNREGKFFADGLKPGKYELRMYADTSVVTPLEIPKDKQGLYEIGALRLANEIKLD